MPWFIRKTGKEHCVVEGTRDNPGDTLKCYPLRPKALAYLAALHIHVPDVQKSFSLLLYNIYSKSEDEVEHRWLGVSTAKVWDREDELVTTEAMDYDIARAYRTKDFPELRLWHVRGFRLGQCDDMSRIDDYALDQGYWNDTPFAVAMKDMITENDGKWKMSRAFYMAEATGLCPCGADLMVGPLNHIVGLKCARCKSLHTDLSVLKNVRHLKIITYDDTITDAPILSVTAVSAYSRSI